MRFSLFQLSNVPGLFIIPGSSFTPLIVNVSDDTYGGSMENIRCRTICWISIGNENQKGVGLEHLTIGLPLRGNMVRFQFSGAIKKEKMSCSRRKCMLVLKILSAWRSRLLTFNKYSPLLKNRSESSLN
jgi:hypothetical protein